MGLTRTGTSIYPAPSQTEMNTKRSGPAVTPQHRAYTDDMSSQPMWLFRALNERFMNQLAQSETDGSAHADARRTYEKLVALLNSNGTQSSADGRHDE